jgi:hypothetical protein
VLCPKQVPLPADRAGRWVQRTLTHRPFPNIVLNIVPREIWFIHGGFLYEVTTYKQLDSWLTPIMQTWQFTP